MSEERKQKMKKTLALILTALSAAVFAAPYSDLPDELKSLPESKIIQIDGEEISLYKNGKCAKDPDSAMSVSYFWIPKDNRYRNPFNIRIYDREKKNAICNFYGRNIPNNEKYNWIKVGSGTISAKTFMYLSTDWHIYVSLGKYFKPDASNQYEFWVSIKAQGPAYVKNSKKENQLAVDRVLLIAK